MPVERLGRTTVGALLVAACWSAILIAGAFLFPANGAAGNESSGSSSIGAVPHASATAPPPETLVGIDGPRVAAVISVPLLVTLAVGIALWLGSRRGAIPAAWVLTGLLAAFNLVAMLTIGIFVLPVTVALVIAVSMRRAVPVP